MRTRDLILATTVLAMSASGAEAASRTFAANSLIIPMEYCFQSAKSQTNLNPTPTCVNKSSTNQDDGILLAYGLVYRLVQNNIPVYVILNPTKVTLSDVDFTVVAPSGAPVQQVTPNTGALTSFFTVGSTANYRGMPFIIDSAYHDAALALMKNSAVFNPTFNKVVLHVSTQSFQAPVKVVLSTTPPKVALLDVGGAAGSVLTDYLTAAGLNTAGTGGTYGSGTPGTIYDSFTADANFTGGGLMSGGYKILWAPHWDGDASQNAVYTAVSTFIDAGNAFFSECASVGTEEGEYDNKGKLQSGGAATYMSTLGFFKTQVPGGFPDAKNVGEAWYHGDVTNVLVQYGDFGFVPQGGSLPAWTPALNSAYKTGVVRLIGTTSPVAANNAIDVFTFAHKDNDSTKGIVVYLGGHSYSGDVAGTRLVLNSLLLTGQVFINSSEVSRSSPIFYADGSTFQGTYMSGTGAAAYPPIAGHLHDYPAGALVNANVSDFGKFTDTWDAANGIPVAASRTINTVVSVAGTMTQIPFTVANVTPIASVMGISTAAATTAINGIRAGGLGGIDHSIPAVIGPSAIAGSASRPTVAYVGGLDGMLHCIGVSGTGVTAGQEVWAFVPPSQLATIDNYAAGVDGSPQVADVFIDPTNSGVKTWKTIVAVTNGAYGGTVDVLDVTDPLNPAWMWTGANTSGLYKMGAANGAAVGMINGTNGVQSVIYLATNDGGTAGNGFNLYALDAGTGTVVWQWDRLYTRHIPTTNTLVPNDVPGTPTVMNTTGDGSLDNWVYYGDLDGKIWAIDAVKGTAPVNPLYDAGADGYPINAGVGAYRDKSTGHIAVVAATGGKDWVPASYTEYTIAVDTSNSSQLFKTNFAVGERVYAAPTISGNDVYFITSLGNFAGNISSSVSDSGNIQRVNLSGGAMTLVAAVKKGDSEVAVNGATGDVIGASAAGETLANAAGHDTSNLAVANAARPFTIGAWIDFH